jgi:hypothetical protein
MPEQIHSVEGMSPVQINEALKAGRLQELLDGTEGEGVQEQPEQKDATWVSGASPSEIAAALKAGELQDLL